MPKHVGEDIREVWDFRLSEASPALYNSGETWVVKIHPNDERNEVLEEYDTGIQTVVGGKRSYFDKKAIVSCFDWLRTVRDKYSRDQLELRKPVVALINASNKEINLIMSESVAAREAGDEVKADELLGKYYRVLKERNAEIKAATDEMKQKIAAGGVQ